MPGPMNFPPQILNRGVPGESLTQEPGKFPYERPPQFTDPQLGLKYLYGKIMREDVVYTMLGMIEAGFPLQTLAQTMLQQGYGEGLWTIQMVPLMAPALVVILGRIAEAAGVDYTLKAAQSKPVPDILLALAEKRQITPAQVGKAQNAVKGSAGSMFKGGIGAGAKGIEPSNQALDEQPRAGLMSPLFGRGTD